MVRLAEFDAGENKVVGGAGQYHRNNPGLSSFHFASNRFGQALIEH